MSQGAPQPPPGPAPNMFDFGNMGMQDMNGIGVCYYCSSCPFHSKPGPDLASAQSAPLLTCYSSAVNFACCFCHSRTSSQRPTSTVFVALCASSLQLQLQPPSWGVRGSPSPTPAAPVLKHLPFTFANRSMFG
jgi:hypothetical protein